MRNKMMAGAIIAVVLLSAAVLFWYFIPSDVSIVSMEVAPSTFPFSTAFINELVVGQLGELRVNLQNNASEDVNVTVSIKNAFVDEKGESLKGFTILAYGNLSSLSDYVSSDTVNEPQKEVLLKPGINSIIVSVGYQVPGTQNVIVEVYRQGKLADSRTIEINVPKPEIELVLMNDTAINGTHEIHTVSGYLQLRGRGSAPGVVVNISVINELTNTTVKAVTRVYELRQDYWPSEPLVVWQHSNTTYDPLRGTRTYSSTETYAPIVVIELSMDKPSDEKYLMSPIVVKGKIGDKYRVVVIARWMDQVVSSEMRIPG